MHISGVSGNEIYCLAQKGFTPGEIVVGNSVVSIGLANGIGATARTFAGGEVQQITSLISDGRHQAIARMEAEAQRDGAIGVTGVDSRLGQLAGFTEFLAQGTGIHGGNLDGKFFSSAASGIGLYCQLDAGYRPLKFAMGNVAYALGIGRGLTGQLRTLTRGEVHEYSTMYNDVRHLALQRLKEEAAAAGANAVVDTRIEMLPYGPGTVELLLTGTASFNPAFSSGRVTAAQVVTSELSGEELWNLASLGYIPHQIVMATSVYSLGVASSVGALLRSVKRGELPEVTKLVYEARENCLELVRKEAIEIGADRVMSTRLEIREIGPGLIELVAIGTAVKKGTAANKPHTDQLIPQALVLDRGGMARAGSIKTLGSGIAPMGVAREGRQIAGNQALGCLFAAAGLSLTLCLGLLTFFLAMMEDM